MKTIHIVFPNGHIIVANVPVHVSLAEIAAEYPKANIYWLQAPLSAIPSTYRVIRFKP